MNRIWQVALREFKATALTPGFIIGALIVPLVFVPVVGLIVVLINQAEPPADRGVVVLVDRSGELTETLVERLSPEEIARRRGDQAKQIVDAVAESVPAGVDPKTLESAAENAAGASGVPKLSIETVELGPDADVDAAIEKEKERLRDGSGRDDASRVLAVVVVDEFAVTPQTDPAAYLALPDAERAEADRPFGSYELFQRSKIDSRTIGELRSGLSWSIRELRFERSGVSRDEVELLSSIDAPPSQEVTADGTERKSSNVLQEVLPFAVIFLLFMGVLTGGQYLLTTTIEEKSSRVVEVLLAAVSPMQLMTGKILGQLAVGLTLLVMYNSIGLFALVMFERGDLISTSTLVFMLVFFLLSYVQIGGFMAGIGASVTELREAQSLMTPVMLVLVFSFYLSMPVSRDPDATYAVVLSMIPPASPFVMLTRIASTEPPPMWQSLLAVAINAVAAYGSIWAAAKVFRVGLLMFGKPPNVKTLLKWIAMA
ncbi:MAG: ABC transporter permease [Planctomycetota bacterium]